MVGVDVWKCMSCLSPYLYRPYHTELSRIFLWSKSKSCSRLRKLSRTPRITIFGPVFYEIGSKYWNSLSWAGMHISHVVPQIWSIKPSNWTSLLNTMLWCIKSSFHWLKNHINWSLRLRDKPIWSILCQKLIQIVNFTSEHYNK